MNIRKRPETKNQEPVLVETAPPGGEVSSQWCRRREVMSEEGLSFQGRQWGK